jgi:hypothetical protein
MRVFQARALGSPAFASPSFSHRIRHPRSRHVEVVREDLDARGPLFRDVAKAAKSRPQTPQKHRALRNTVKSH